MDKPMSTYQKRGAGSRSTCYGHLPAGVYLTEPAAAAASTPWAGRHCGGRLGTGYGVGTDRGVSCTLNVYITSGGQVPDNDFVKIILIIYIYIYIYVYI